MRTLRTLLLASSLLVLPIGTGLAQTPPPQGSAAPSAAPATAPAPAAKRARGATPATPPAAQPAAQPVTPAPSDAPAASTEGAAPPASGARTGGLPPLQTDDAVAGGIGLASLVVGVALVGVASGLQGSIASSAPKDVRGNPTCSAKGTGDGGTTADVAKCADLRSQASLGTDLGNAGVTLMITGGLLAGAAAAYWLLSSPAPAPGPKSARAVPGPTFRVAPAVGANFGGLVVVGSF
jgi:hypothetical protein